MTFEKIHWLSEVKRELLTPRYANRSSQSCSWSFFGKQPPTKENAATLQTTESILSDYYSTFWVGKEAEESVHRRWRYLDRILNLAYQMLRSQNILQPNKKKYNSGQHKNIQHINIRIQASNYVVDSQLNSLKWWSYHVLFLVRSES